MSDERETLARLIDADAWREPILPETFRALEREASEYRADEILSSDWLFEHDRQVAERAWEEGARWAAVEFGKDASVDESQVGLVPSDNPYRKEQENNNA